MKSHLLIEVILPVPFPQRMFHRLFTISNQNRKSFGNRKSIEDFHHIEFDFGDPNNDCFGCTQCALQEFSDHTYGGFQKKQLSRKFGSPLDIFFMLLMYFFHNRLFLAFFLSKMITRFRKVCCSLVDIQFGQICGTKKKIQKFKFFEKIVIFFGMSTRHLILGFEIYTAIIASQKSEKNVGSS